VHNGTVSDLTPENRNYSVSVTPREELVNRVWLSWCVLGGYNKSCQAKVIYIWIGLL